MKIYVAGHRGLVGSAITEYIESQGKHEWIGKTHQELNLLDKKSVEKFIAEEMPDCIILAAAKVGGIKANSLYPVEFLAENLEIQNNVINAAHKYNVEKFVFLGSSCIYPKFSPQPIKEEYLLTGPLEPTNEPYAIAKIAGLKMIQAYRKEYNKHWISLMPTNIYGPNDNFDLNTSHVLPAILRKLHIAKTGNFEAVELWGTGGPRREFLFSRDLAEAVIFLMENYDEDTALNIGSGSDLSIAQLADMIADTVNYRGKIIWNSDIPDGTPKKLLDTTLVNSIGWRPKTELKTGIEITYEWYLRKIFS